MYRFEDIKDAKVCVNLLSETVNDTIKDIIFVGNTLVSICKKHPDYMEALEDYFKKDFKSIFSEFLFAKKCALRIKSDITESVEKLARFTENKDLRIEKIKDNEKPIVNKAFFEILENGSLTESVEALLYFISKRNKKADDNLNEIKKRWSDPYGKKFCDDVTCVREECFGKIEKALKEVTTKRSSEKSSNEK